MAGFTARRRAAKRDVIITLSEALALVVLVVFIFLQNWRTTLIPTIAIPVSLIATLAVMQANSTQTSFQVAYYHGTPCGNTVVKGDIVVSDLKMDGTAALTMNLVPFGFLYINQVALVAGGPHP